MDHGPLTSFSIRAQPIGGQVIVGGTDLSGRLSGINLELGASEPSRLTLFVRPGEGPIHGVAVVEQVLADGDGSQLSPAEAVRSIDPATLEAMIEARPTRLTERPVEVMLAVLVELLSGQT